MKILTSTSCTRCKAVKSILDKKEIPYEEVDINSEEGKLISLDYEPDILPFMILDDGISTIDINTVLEYHNS